MNEVPERREESVSASNDVGQTTPPKYVSKKRGAPGFSGRSTRTIHAACARARGGAKVGQQKQIR